MEVEKARTNALNQVVDQLQEPLRQVFNIVRWKKRWPERSALCESTTIRAGSYSLELARCNLLSAGRFRPWPRGGCFMTKIKRSQASLKAKVTRTPDCDGDCAHCKFDWIKSIDEAANNTRDAVGSLCLSCAEEGDFQVQTFICFKHH